MKTFYLGNFLRGLYKGEFESHEEAWKWLGKRFMWGFPTDSFSFEGKISWRHVVMYVKKKNPYVFNGNIRCKEDIVYDFEVTDELKEEINKRVKIATEISIEP